MLSPMRMQRPTVEVVNREEGDPNKHFLRKHGMDKHSHPMYWFNALLPPTPKDNHAKLKDIDEKGDGKAKKIHVQLDVLHQHEGKHS